MKKKKAQRLLWVAGGCSGILILLFVYTALSKLFKPEVFRDALMHSPLLASYANFITYALPIFELAIALLLFVPLLRKAGLIVSAGMMIMLTAYLAYMILFAPQLPCSCGGAIEALSWKQHIVFNIAFVLIAITGFAALYKTGKHSHNPP